MNNITEKIIIEIGQYLNIPMWEALTNEEKEIIQNNDRDAAYSDYNIGEIKNYYVYEKMYKLLIINIYY